jgi:hypothetical protein
LLTAPAKSGQGGPDARRHLRGAPAELQQAAPAGHKTAERVQQLHKMYTRYELNKT